MKKFLVGALIIAIAHPTVAIAGDYVFIAENAKNPKVTVILKNGKKKTVALAWQGSKKHGAKARGLKASEIRKIIISSQGAQPCVTTSPPKHGYKCVISR